jgi:nucleotide-binding universal stress UspA family protein
MSYKTILVCLNDIPGLTGLMAAASALAQTFEAHITGLYVVPAVQVYPSGGVDLMPQIFEGNRIYFQENAKKVRDRFETAMRKEGLSFAFHQIDSKSYLISDDMIDEGRSADLIVVNAVDREAGVGVELDFAERLVIGAGRPVLILPHGDIASLQSGEALVGWNGSREAARAAFDAVPILKLYGSVRIVSVDPHRDPERRGSIAGADLAESLARHGVKATAEPYLTDGLDPGLALMQHAEDTGARLIVMGAYGHSRFREFILGGSTASVLARLSRPVLMSH